MTERRFPPPAVTWPSSKPVQAKAAAVPALQPARRPGPAGVVQHKAGIPAAVGPHAPARHPGTPPVPIQAKTPGRLVAPPPAPPRPAPPVVQAKAPPPPVVQAKAPAGQAAAVLQAFHPGKNPLDGLSEREIRNARRALKRRGGAGRVTADRIRHAVVEHRKAVRQALDADGEHNGWHIPTSAWVIHKVGATYYKFYNDILGYVDFDTPGAYAAGDTTEDGTAVPAATVYGNMPYAAAPYSVNIFHSTVKGVDYMVDPATGGVSANALKQNSRAPHDTVADALRGAPKPAGYTWHHHKTKGRMDLVKTTVHAAFAHRGGFSLWGRK